MRSFFNISRIHVINLWLLILALGIREYSYNLLSLKQYTGALFTDSNFYNNNLY